MNKKRSFIFLFLSCLTIICLFSCERDDICAENVTPFLVIDFVELEDSDSPNNVVDLQIEYIGTNMTPGDTTKFVFDNATTTESVSLLLPTFKNSASFRFIQNFGTEINEEGEIIPNLTEAEVDTVEFRYNTDEEYVSRACGFKISYSNLSVEITEGDGNTITEGFIKSRNIINQIIEDEEEAHLHFLH